MTAFCFMISRKLKGIPLSKLSNAAVRSLNPSIANLWLRDFSGNMRKPKSSLTHLEETINWLCRAQDNAKKAVHFERKLELAMEGHRFFDLVRWGEASTTLTAYLAYEMTKRDYLKTAVFVAGKNEYYPIPQHQIDLVGSNILQQNLGY